MNAAAWTCLLLPLASTVLITLGGTRISRRVAGYVSTATTMGAFAAALVAFVELLGKSPDKRASTSPPRGRGSRRGRTTSASRCSPTS